MGCGWVVGGRGVGACLGGLMRIMPSFGSILQAKTSQILSLDEKPRWSRVYSTNITRTNATRTNVTETNVAWVNIQNTLEHLHLVDLGYMQKFQYLDHQEVVKKDGLRGVGGWSHENNATLWLHLASWNLPDSQFS